VLTPLIKSNQIKSKYNYLKSIKNWQEASLVYPTTH